MSAQILAGEEGISASVEILRRGGVVGLPTETVYGLAADAFQSLAVAGIFEAKGRPLTDPLIVHLPEAGWLDRVALFTILSFGRCCVVSIPHWQLPAPTASDESAQHQPLMSGLN